MDSRTKIIVAALALFVLIGVGYVLYTGNKNGGESVSISEMGGASDTEQQFVSLSSELSLITFDTTIFSDPRFQALSDIHTSVLTEPQGRHDPFAALGSQ